MIEPNDGGLGVQFGYSLTIGKEIVADAEGRLMLAAIDSSVPAASSETLLLK